MFERAWGFESPRPHSIRNSCIQRTGWPRCAHGVVLTPERTATNLVDDAGAQAHAVYGAGLRQFWLAQRVDYYAISPAGLMDAAVSRLGVGTLAVPITATHLGMSRATLYRKIGQYGIDATLWRIRQRLRPAPVRAPGR